MTGSPPIRFAMPKMNMSTANEHQDYINMTTSEELSQKQSDLSAII